MPVSAPELMGPLTPRAANARANDDVTWAMAQDHAWSDAVMLIADCQATIPTRLIEAIVARANRAKSAYTEARAAEDITRHAHLLQLGWEQ